MTLRRLLRPAVAVAVMAVVLRSEPLLGLALGLGVWAALAWYRPPLEVGSIAAGRRHPARVLFGEPIEVETTVVNEGGIPVPWLSLTDPVPFDLAARSTRWVTSLGPGESRTFRRTLESRRRGYHTLGPGIVSTGDTFGLRRAQGRPVAPTTVLVYPRIVPLERPAVEALAPLALVRTRLPLHEDPTRVVGVRDYTPGDPVRRIHWTASATHGDLLVKRLEHGIAREVVVAVDLGFGAHPQPGRRRSAELSVTVAASLLHHLVTVEGRQVGLRLAGVDSPTGRRLRVSLSQRSDVAHLMQALEHLARVRVARDPERSGVLDPAGLGFGVAVVLVTGRIDEDAAAGVLRLRRLGAVPSVVVTGGRSTGRWEGALEAHGVPVRSASFLDQVSAL